MQGTATIHDADPELTNVARFVFILLYVLQASKTLTDEEIRRLLDEQVR